jgi:hypothetical protein
MDIDLSNIDRIAVPADLGVASKFDDVRRLVRRHVSLVYIGPQRESHRTLTELIQERCAAAAAREEQILEQTEASTPRGRELRSHNLAVAKGEREAYDRLLAALTLHCGEACRRPW